MQEDAHNFYFSQPVVGHVPPQTLLADSCRKDFDFNTMSLESIQKYTMKVLYCYTHYGGLTMGRPLRPFLPPSPYPYPYPYPYPPQRGVVEVV